MHLVWRFFFVRVILFVHSPIRSFTLDIFPAADFKSQFLFIFSEHRYFIFLFSFFSSSSIYSTTIRNFCYLFFFIFLLLLLKKFVKHEMQHNKQSKQSANKKNRIVWYVFPCVFDFSANNRHSPWIYIYFLMKHW